MSSRVDSRDFQTVHYTEHPSLKLCSKFHGHIVKTFSPLPAEGKCIEIIKRIVLVVISPLAYFALALIGILGYPYSVERTKQVQVRNSDNTLSRELQTYTPNERSSFILEHTKEQMEQTVGFILVQHNISKMKYVVSCKIADEQQYFEIDIFTDTGFINSVHFNESIRDPLEEVNKWFSEKFGIYGLKSTIHISGHAFCLAGDKIHHGYWSATDNSTKDNIRFNATTENSTPSKKHLKEYFEACFDIKLSDQIKSPADFFGKKLIASS